MSGDILEEAASVVAEHDAAHEQALKKCDEVRRFIQHRQVDRGWGGQLDQAQLLAVAQHNMPDGTPLWNATFLAQGIVATFVQMLIGEQDGHYEKLPPVAILGSIQTV